MEARSAVERKGGLRWAAPAWLLGVVPLAIIVLALGLFAALGGPGLGERTGPPAEELAVERTVLRAGTIELTLRNDGPDPVRIAQVFVNDAFADFTATAPEVGRLGAERVRISYPWVEGEAYEVGLLTASGTTITHEIAAAVETPARDASFFGLMALLGIYVGVIPIALGMLWLPFVRRIGAGWVRAIMAVTIGLLGFLAIDATFEGLETAGEGPHAFGGPLLVALGGVGAYLALTAVDAHLRDRRAAAGSDGSRLALMVAAGIGLHNLGEGLAIGSAYAIGALALGAFLVVGFALHNTTEGLAIVAPLARGGTAAIPLRRLAGLGLLAGAPAILGAWIGAVAFNPSVAALLLGVGAGAIVQVIQQLVPSIRDAAGRVLHPGSVAGIAIGLVVLYVTGLMVSV